MNQTIYLDNASTTRCDSRSAQILAEYARELYGNPASHYELGEKSAEAIQKARAFFAKYFGVDPLHVIFTGSGTEADNLAIYGPALQTLRNCCEGDQAPKPEAQIICSSIEHPAVDNTCDSLECFGFRIRKIPINQEGEPNLEKLKEWLKDETLLVSMMAVNNITGVKLPYEETARLVKEISPQTLFHVDAIQAFGKVDVPVKGSAVDLVSLSSHKVHGPKGVGAMIVLNSDLYETSRLCPILWGGGQEQNCRSGTQNVGGISAFHVAAENTLKRRAEFSRNCKTLRNLLRSELEKRDLLSAKGESITFKIHWNSPEKAVPYIVNLSVPGLPANAIAQKLAKMGCYISTGSACSAHKIGADPVLISLGYPNEIAGSALRISFGNDTSEANISYLVECLDKSIEEIKAVLV